MVAHTVTGHATFDGAALTATASLSVQAVAGLKGFGWYIGGNAYPAPSTNLWTVQPNVGSFYDSWNIYNASTGVVTLPPGMVAALTDPNIDFVQWEYQTGTNETETNIANGVDDARIKAIFAKVNSYGKRTAAFLNNERDTRTDLPAADTVTTWLAAAAKWKALTAAYPHVEPGIWLAMYEAQATVLSYIPADPTGWMHLGGDPYDKGDHPVSETATGTWQHVRDIANAAGWGNVMLHITETGIVVDKTFTSANQKTWIGTIPQAMVDLNVATVTVFDDNSGGTDYVPTDPTVLAAYGVVCAQIVP